MSTEPIESIKLRVLHFYMDIKPGDQYPTNLEELAPHQRLAEVREVTNHSFMYVTKDGYNNGVSGDENLDNLVLLRRTKEGLVILAGRNAYVDLVRPNPLAK